MTSLPLVRVRLKHTDAGTFVQRFAANVTRGGIFLASRDPRPVGVLVRFEVTLVDGSVMLAGQGRVAWVKPYDAAEPSRAHGMGVQFTELERGSKAMLDRLLDRKEATGKGTGRSAVTGTGAVGGSLSSNASGAIPERRVSEGNLTEFDSVEDTALRRALDRARSIGPVPDSLDELLSAAPDSAAPSLEEALADLPRYFARGRGSGLFRLPPYESQDPRPLAPSPSAPPAEPVAAAAAVEPTPSVGGDETPVPVGDEPTRPVQSNDHQGEPS